MRKLQKKEQKEINKHTRALNKNLREDRLWRGRFYVHQTDYCWERFEDNSGGDFRCWIEIRDKKTGLYHGFSINKYDASWRLFEEGNKFIVEYSGVWDDIQAVRNDTTDWSKVKWKPVRSVF